MAITYTEFPEKKRVEFTVSGQITKADYDSIAGPMEAFIDAHGTVQMIEVVDHFSGFAPGLLLPGLRFDIKALPHISHIAVVTDIGWLSQYPHEEEICFAPLTGIEVQATRVVNNVLVVNVRLNVNLNALTIEQVVSKRRKVCVDMLKSMQLELAEEFK